MKKGSHHTSESIATMSANRKGKACGEDNAMCRFSDVREKSSRNHKGVKRPDILGNKNPMYRPEVREKVSTHCSMKRPEVAAKNAAARTGQKRLSIRGENHPNWKGGTSPTPYCEKWTNNLRKRIRAFFGNKCILCGKSAEQNG